MQKKVFAAAMGVLLLAPAAAFAAGTTTPQELQITGSAVVEGRTVPVHATVSAGQQDLQLSATKTDGSTPVTITFYLAPKPKPIATSSQGAAVESSQNIQDSIGNISPQVEQTVAPFFKLVDGARDSASNIIDQQLTQTKQKLGPDAGQVLGAEATKNAASNPGGTFWFILQTLYLYLLTLLGFIVNSAMVFYPVLMLLVLYVLWRLVKRFRRPSY